MDQSRSLDPQTLLLYGDQDPAESAIAPPLYQSVPFAADSEDEFALMNQRPLPERAYRRNGNPTQRRLETLLAQLEGAESALVTASGMGAMTTIALALLDAGDHVVSQRSSYGGTLSLFKNLTPRLGITATFVDQTDIDAFDSAITERTKLIVLESPSNPLLQLTDLGTVADLARSRSVLTVVDNTVATPLNQRPLDLGIDLVMHSVTKSLSGHSDVLAGAVLGKRQLIERIWRTHVIAGAVASPFDCWLAIRGLRTLRMRLEWQDHLALKLARRLEKRSPIARVNYPGLESHPQYELARRQMRGHGGLLSFEVVGGHSAAQKFIDTLNFPARASSLGGTRSLVAQPAAMWAKSMSAEQLDQAGVPPGLIRLAVGLEADTDLVADIDAALDALEAPSS